MFQKSIVCVVAATLFLSSCSAFNWTRTPMTVNASEPDAKIYIDGEYMGIGRVQTSVKRRTNHTVLARKDGFYPAQKNVSYCLGTVGIIDLLFGFVWLVPFVGLAFPGAYVADEENIALLLEEKAK